MKFKFLGTSAAERVPAVFCNCKTCNNVRKSGGKNIRTCSQAIIDEDLLIDLCPDTYMHVVQNNLRLDKIKYLLVTHSHGDHFTEYELAMRGVAFAHDITEPDLKIYCNKEVAETWAKGDIHPDVKLHQCVRIVEPFKTYKLDDYEITPLPAHHTKPEQSLIYIIKKDGKTLLYGNDSGYYYEEVFDYIQKNNIVFDLVALDCTDGFIDLWPTATHMSLNIAQKVCERFHAIGAVTQNTKVYVTHFSHNGDPIHEKMEKATQKWGAKPAFDGLEIIL